MSDDLLARLDDLRQSRDLWKKAASDEATENAILRADNQRWARALGEARSAQWKAQDENTKLRAENERILALAERSIREVAAAADAYAEGEKPEIAEALWSLSSDLQALIASSDA